MAAVANEKRISGTRLLQCMVVLTVLLSTVSANRNETSAALSYAQGLGLTISTAGVEQMFTVQAVDVYDKFQTAPTTTEYFMVELTGAAETKTDDGACQEIWEKSGNANILSPVSQTFDTGSNAGYRFLGKYWCHYTSTKAPGSYFVDVYLAKQGGLYGQYYENIWFTQAPVLTQVDSSFNRNWGTGFITQTASDYVGIRWTGKILPEFNEEYTFYLTADDGARLYIDGTLLIDSWDSHCNETHATMTLSGGLLYDIKIDYKEVTGPAEIGVSWESRSLRPKEYLPSDRLFYLTHIKNSPFNMESYVGKICATTSTAAGTGLSVATAGTVTGFTLVARDSSNNLRLHETGVFEYDSKGAHDSPLADRNVECYSGSSVTCPDGSPCTTSTAYNTDVTSCSCLCDPVVWYVRAIPTRAAVARSEGEYYYDDIPGHGNQPVGYYKTLSTKTASNGDGMALVTNTGSQGNYSVQYTAKKSDTYKVRASLVCPPACPVNEDNVAQGDSGGLSAQFFDGPNFEGPAKVNISAAATSYTNTDWVAQLAKLTDYQNTGFSVRFTGLIRPTQNKDYSYSALVKGTWHTSNDQKNHKVYGFIDGRPLYQGQERNLAQSDANAHYETLLTAHYYDFVIEYSCLPGGASDTGLKFELQSADSGTFGTIPNAALYRSYDIMGSPFSMVAFPAPTCASTSIPNGIGLTTSQTAGVQTTFTIQAKDQYYNLRNYPTEANTDNDGGEKFKVRLSASGNAATRIGGVVVDNDDSTYTVTYTPSVVNAHLSGNTRASPLEYMVAITMTDPSAATCGSNCDIHGAYDNDLSCDRSYTGAYSSNAYTPSGSSCYKVNVYTAEIHGTNSTTSGSGLTVATAGIQTEFTVQAVDYFGNFRTRTADNFRVTLAGADKTHEMTTGTSNPYTDATVVSTQEYRSDPLSTTSGANKIDTWSTSTNVKIEHTQAKPTSRANYGSHLVEYTVTTDGMFDLNVAENYYATGELNGSPHRVFVHAASVCAFTSEATGDGLLYATAGVVSQFTVQARDQFKNNRTSGGDNFIVRLLPYDLDPLTDLCDEQSSSGNKKCVRGGGATVRETWDGSPTDRYGRLYGNVEDQANGQYLVKYTPELLVGSGLLATFFDDDIDVKRVGTAVHYNVDFDWSGSSGALPHKDLDAGTRGDLSVRWEGFVKPTQEGVYTFSVEVTNGAGSTAEDFRLYVKDLSHVDDTEPPKGLVGTNFQAAIETGPDTTHLFQTPPPLADTFANDANTLTGYTSGTLKLRKDVLYDIVLEYWKYSGDTSIKLKWAFNGGSFSVVPHEVLWRRADKWRAHVTLAVGVQHGSADTNGDYLSVNTETLRGDNKPGLVQRLWKSGNVPSTGASYFDAFRIADEDSSRFTSSNAGATWDPVTFTEDNTDTNIAYSNTRFSGLSIPTTFATRYEGLIKPTVTGSTLYTFTANVADSDDYVWVYVDRMDEPLLMVDGSSTSASGTIRLEGTRFYDIKVDHFVKAKSTSTLGFQVKRGGVCDGPPNDQYGTKLGGGVVDCTSNGNTDCKTGKCSTPFIDYDGTAPTCGSDADCCSNTDDHTNCNKMCVGGTAANLGKQCTTHTTNWNAGGGNAECGSSYAEQVKYCKRTTCRMAKSGYNKRYRGGAGSCKLAVTTAATLDKEMLFQDRHTKLSPWSDIAVSSNRTCFSQSVVAGAGLSTQTAGVPTTFTVQVRDAYQNKRYSGGDTLLVNIEGVNDTSTGTLLDGVTVTPTVEDRNDGTYVTTYSAEKKGNYKFTIESVEGQGLDATYYNQPDLQGSTQSRIESKLWLDWGRGGPCFCTDQPSCCRTQYDYRNHWSAKFEGKLLAPDTGNYSLILSADDGARLYVGSLTTPVLDRWQQSCHKANVTVSLVAGTLYDFKLVYRERVGPAYLKLSWSSASMAETPIPTTAFRMTKKLGNQASVGANAPYETSPLNQKSMFPFVKGGTKAVHPNETRAAQSTVTGTGLTVATAGYMTDFTVQAHDAFGNVREHHSDLGYIVVRAVPDTLEGTLAQTKNDLHPAGVSTCYVDVDGSGNDGDSAGGYRDQANSALTNGLLEYDKDVRKTSGDTDSAFAATWVQNDVLRLRDHICYAAVPAKVETEGAATEARYRVSYTAYASDSFKVHSSIAAIQNGDRFAAASGVGLMGYYYDGNLAALRAQRIDESIDFSWETSEVPHVDVVAASNYSIRWEGLFKAAHSESHTFSVLVDGTDEHVSLWFDNKRVMRDDDTPATTRSVAVGKLAQNQYYDIKLEYRESGKSDSKVQFKYQTGTTVSSSTLVPKSAMYQSYDIGGTPTTSTVHPDVTCSYTTAVTGAGISAATAGHMNYFNITAKDRWMNLRMQGGDAFAVRLEHVNGDSFSQSRTRKGRWGVPNIDSWEHSDVQNQRSLLYHADVSDLGNGTYTVSYVVERKSQSVGASQGYHMHVHQGIVGGLQADVYNGNGLGSVSYSVRDRGNVNNDAYALNSFWGTQAIDYSWGASDKIAIGIGDGSAPAVAAGTGIKWHGFIKPHKTGEYTFYTLKHDKDETAILRIDNVNNEYKDYKLINDNANLEPSANVTLLMDRMYDIELTYKDARDATESTASRMRLSWKAPGEEKKIVPTTVLYLSRPISHFSKTDYGLEVEHDVTCASRTPSYGIGLSVATAGMYAKFTIQSRDQFENIIDQTTASQATADEYVVQIDGKTYHNVHKNYVKTASSLYEKVSDEVTWGISRKTALGVGAYEVTYTLTRVGQYDVHVGLASSGGLKAEYFSNMHLVAPADFTRTGAEAEKVDFNWGTGFVPAGGYARDYLSVRWSGFVKAENSEKYTFYVDADDAVRLWVDRTLLIDQWEASGGEHNATMDALAGDLYEIKLEYKEVTGGAHAKLLWHSDTVEKDVIPTHLLYYTSSPVINSPFRVVVHPAGSQTATNRQYMIDTDGMLGGFTASTTYPDTYPPHGAAICATTSFAVGQGLTIHTAGHESTFTITSKDRFDNFRTTGGDSWIIRTEPGTRTKLNSDHCGRDCVGGNVQHGTDVNQGSGVTSSECVNTREPEQQFKCRITYPAKYTWGLLKGNGLNGYFYNNTANGPFAAAGHWGYQTLAVNKFPYKTLDLSGAFAREHAELAEDLDKEKGFYAEWHGFIRSEYSTTKEYHFKLEKSNAATEYAKLYVDRMDHPACNLWGTTDTSHSSSSTSGSGQTLSWIGNDGFSLLPNRLYNIKIVYNNTGERQATGSTIKLSWKEDTESSFRVIPYKQMFRHVDHHQLHVDLVRGTHSNTDGDLTQPGGLLADYYSTSDLTSGNARVKYSVADIPAANAVAYAEKLHFETNGDLDTPSQPTANLFAVYRGVIKPSAAAHWFQVVAGSNAYVRFFVERRDQPLIDTWDSETDNELSGAAASGGGLKREWTFSNGANKYYDIYIEYYTKAPGSVALNVKWSTDGSTFSVIPQAKLFQAYALQGSPFTTKVHEDVTCAYKTTTYGLGLTVATAGVRADFTLKAKDQFGNQRAMGGVDDFVVQLSHTNYPTVAADVQDNNDGSYLVSYMLKNESGWSDSGNAYGHEGKYDMEVRLIVDEGAGTTPKVFDSGNSWYGHTTKVRVYEHGTYGPTSKSCGHGLTLATAGIVSTFTVEAVDEFDNHRSVSNDEWLVRLSAEPYGKELDEENLVRRENRRANNDFRLPWLSDSNDVSVSGTDWNDKYHEFKYVPTTASTNGVATNLSVGLALGGDQCVDATGGGQLTGCISEGLYATYFYDVGLTRVANTQVDAQVNMDVGTGYPTTQVGKREFYSVRWTGFYSAASAATYTFSVSVKDGVRLWIDNSLLIDKWTETGTGAYTGTIPLAANTLYDVKMEYRKMSLATGNGLAKLYVNSGSGQNLVSSSNLYYTVQSLHMQDNKVLLIEPASTCGQTSVAAGPGLTLASAGEVSTFTITSYDRYRNLRGHSPDSEVDNYLVRFEPYTQSSHCDTQTTSETAHYYDCFYTGRRYHGSLVDNKDGTHSASYRPTMIANGGITASYFDDLDLTDLRAELNSATLDFSWGTGKPHTNLTSANQWSARFEGFYRPTVSGEHTFSVEVGVVANERFRLYVDRMDFPLAGKASSYGSDLPGVDSWSAYDWASSDAKADYLSEGKIWLQQHRYYKIKLEYKDTTGTAASTRKLKLYHEHTSQSKAVIDYRRLYQKHSDQMKMLVTQAVGVGMGYKYGAGIDDMGLCSGSHGTNCDAQGGLRYFKRYAASFDADTYAWDDTLREEGHVDSINPATALTKATGDGDNAFSIRFEGFVKPTKDTVTFTVQAGHNDDRFNLYVERMDIPLIDNWDHSADTTALTQGYTFTEGNNRLYDIKLDVFAAVSGTSTMRLDWDSTTSGNGNDERTNSDRISQKYLYQAYEVSGSPFYPIRTETAPTCGATSRAFGTGLSHSVAGYTATFTVQARDEFSNQRRTADDMFMGRVRRTPTSGELVHVNMTNDGDTTYRGEYRVDKRTYTGDLVTTEDNPAYESSVAFAVGNGVFGAYFNNSDLTSASATRKDADINFAWGTNHPAPDVRTSSFSVRWSGYLQAQHSEEHTFYAETDGGVVVVVNGQTVIDYWNGEEEWEYAGSIRLLKGVMYSVIVEYRNVNAGNPHVKLSWESASQTKQIVPSRYLAPSRRALNVDSENSGSPWIMYVEPDQICASTTRTYKTNSGDGLSYATRDTAAYFTIQGLDRFHNNRSQELDSNYWKVTVGSASDAEGSVTRATFDNYVSGMNPKWSLRAIRVPGNGTGTVMVDDDKETVRGNGTKFDIELEVGDTIHIMPKVGELVQRGIVKSIASDGLSLTLEQDIDSALDAGHVFTYHKKPSHGSIAYETTTSNTGKWNANWKATKRGEYKLHTQMVSETAVGVGLLGEHGTGTTPGSNIKHRRIAENIDFEKWATATQGAIGVPNIKEGSGASTPLESVKWTGWIKFPDEGYYTFYVDLQALDGYCGLSGQNWVGWTTTGAATDYLSCRYHSECTNQGQGYGKVRMCSQGSNAGKRCDNQARDFCNTVYDRYCEPTNCRLKTDYSKLPYTFTNEGAKLFVDGTHILTSTDYETKAVIGPISPAKLYKIEIHYHFEADSGTGASGAHKTYGGKVKLSWANKNYGKTVVPKEALFGAGHHLWLEAFDNHDLNPAHAGGVVGTRQDPMIDFYYYQDSNDYKPHPNITTPSDFSMRWTGLLEASGSGDNTFTFSAAIFDGKDEGDTNEERVRLYVDRQDLPCIDGWRIISEASHVSAADSLNWKTCTMKLTGGRLYDIKMEYSKYGTSTAGGRGGTSLRWSSSDLSITTQVIPHTNLWAPRHVAGSPYTVQVENKKGFCSNDSVKACYTDEECGELPVTCMGNDVCSHGEWSTYASDCQ